MDCEVLVSSYKRYKADTNAFVDWLAEMATACGYFSTSENTPKTSREVAKVPLTLGEKLREKAAKKALKREAEDSTSTSTSTKKTTTRELLKQAMLVAKNPKIVNVPNSMIQIIERAVEARKRCAKWFRATPAHEEKSNESHQYFIGILEQILVILAPRYEEQSSEESKAAAKNSTEDLVLPSVIEAQNRFQTLGIGDAEEIWEDLNSLPTPTETAQYPLTAINAPDDPLDGKQLEEMENRSEMSFAAFCFWEDLHRIQDFIKETWEIYKRGEIDLISASFITNAAFDIVKQAEAEITQMIFQDDVHNPYIMLCDFTIGSGFLGDGIDAITEQKELDAMELMTSDRKATLSGSFIYYESARTLVKGIRSPDLLNIFKDDGVGISKPLDLSEMEENTEYDRLLSAMVLEVSYEIFYDSELDEDLRRSLNNGKLPPEVAKHIKPPLSPDLIPDRFIQGPQGMGGDTYFTTSLVFASQILLDIHAILGDKVSDGYRELNASIIDAQRKSQLEKGNEGKYQNSGEAIPFASGDVMNDLSTTFTAAASKTWGRFKNHVSKSLESEKTEFIRVWDSQNLEERRGKLEDYFILRDYKWACELPGTKVFEWLSKYSTEITSDPSFYLKHNPYNCGTRKLQLLLQSERAGICVANHHRSILLISHLYNAVRQLGILEMSWPQMDRLTELHIGSLFRGELAKNENEFFQRLMLTYGLKHSSIFTYKRTRNLDSIPWSKMFGTKPKLACTKTSDILRMLGDDQNPITMGQCLYRINGVIQETTTANSGAKSKKNHNTQLTSVELLYRLREWFPKAVQDMETDYFGLSRTCTDLLRRVRLTILVELGTDYKLGNPPKSKDPEFGFGDMVVDIFDNHVDYQKAKSRALKNSSSDQALGSPEMMVVGKVFRKFIANLKPEDRGAEGSDTGERVG